MKKLILPLFILLIFGCASKNVYLTEDFTRDDIISNIKIKSLSIVDQRQNVSDRELKIPTFSLRGNNDEIFPALTEEHKQLIESEILSYTKNSGREVDAIVHIEDGRKQFKASFGGEHETVLFKIKLTLYDGIRQPYLLSSWGEGFFEVKSMDASADYIEKLYQKVIKSSINNLFKSVYNFLKDIENQEKPKSVTEA